jgi:hypothetical protein
VPAALSKIAGKRKKLEFPPMPMSPKFQVHAYGANSRSGLAQCADRPDHVTGDEMVAAMDKVGVDGAILSPRFRCTATTPAMPWKCSGRIPAARDRKPVDP